MLKSPTSSTARLFWWVRARSRAAPCAWAWRKSATADRRLLAGQEQVAAGDEGGCCRSEVGLEPDVHLGEQGPFVRPGVRSRGSGGHATGRGGSRWVSAGPSTTVNRPLVSSSGTPQQRKADRRAQPVAGAAWPGVAPTGHDRLALGEVEDPAEGGLRRKRPPAAGPARGPGKVDRRRGVDVARSAGQAPAGPEQEGVVEEQAQVGRKRAVGTRLAARPTTPALTGPRGRCS